MASVPGYYPLNEFVLYFTHVGKGRRRAVSLMPMALQVPDDVSCWLFDPEGKTLIPRKEAAARRQAADFADVMTICNTCFSMACYY